MPSSSAAAGGGEQQWAWLGLLKWTLAHQDGTVPSEESPTMMSEEDKAFLEKVMTEGIIDESERMKFILQQFLIAMEYYKNKSMKNQNITIPEEEEEEKEEFPPPDQDELEELLQELRDIVEQVDYARGFVNLKGCQYLLGAISATTTMTSTTKTKNNNGEKQPAAVIPNGIRNMCLGIVATLAQNNPPVQKELLELGAIKILSDIFLHEEALPLSSKIKIMQAMSAIVRCYDLTEAVFEELPQAPVLMVQGLLSSKQQQQQPSSSSSNAAASLNLKTLFFLRAFLTSDDATPKRANKFRHAIAMIADTDSDYLNDDKDDNSNNSSNDNVDYVAAQIRESSISLLQQLLERRLAVSLLLERKQHLASLGVQRIQKLRSLTGDAAEFTKVELQNWESFLIQLARTEPENEKEKEDDGKAAASEMKLIAN